MFEIVKERLSIPLPAIQLVNLEDIALANTGIISQDKVRTITVNDWRIDQSVKTLALPRMFMELLGINPLGYVRLRIQDTEICLKAREAPEGRPTLVGQIPLELLEYSDAD